MSIKRQHYVTVVPIWLVDTLHQRDVPMTVVNDFEKLSSIVSFEDVCFYYHYLKNLSFYTDGLFDDMDSIAKMPANQMWVAMNEKELLRIGQQFDFAFQSNQEKLATTEVPVSIRKTDYVPLAITSDCIALLGRSLGSSVSRHAFLKECISQLTQQLTFDEYKQFKVFNAFTKEFA